MLDLVRGLDGRRRRARCCSFCEKDPADDVAEGARLRGRERRAQRPHARATSCSSRVAFADEGPTRKRGRPRAAWPRYFRIRKRTIAHHDRSSPATTRTSSSGAVASASPPGRGAAAERRRRLSRGRRVAAQRRRRGTTTITTTITITTTRSTSSRRRPRRWPRPRSTDEHPRATTSTRPRPSTRRQASRTPRTRPTSRRRSDRRADDATDERRLGRERSNGSEGQPLRVPARHHHRLEVALDRRGRRSTRTSSSRTGRSVTTCASSSSAPR